jgi:Ras family protein
MDRWGSDQKLNRSLSYRTSLCKQRNIVVLGFSMVGKTAICCRFAQGEWIENYEPTYEHTWCKQYTTKATGQQVECHIKDTQGLSDQEIVRHEYGLGYHGYVLVYSIASARSLETLKGIHEKLLNLTVNTNIPRVLVGNKADLDSNDFGREVTIEEGQQLASEWGCAFVESSAKWDTGIDTIFESLLGEIDKFSEPEPSYALNSSKCLDVICCRPTDGQSTQVQAQTLQNWVKCLVSLSLTVAIATLVLGVILAVTSEEGLESLLLSGTLVGFSCIYILVSLFGWFGTRDPLCVIA